MKKIGDGAHDAGGTEGLVMGLSLLVMGLKPQQPSSLVYEPGRATEKNEDG